MLESDFYLDLQFKFLGELYIHLKNAEQSYRLYLENDRKFLFAKMLKSSNDAILLLLGKYAYLLNDSLFRDSQQLTLHLSIWKEKWEELEKKINPENDTEFVFENNFTFPREASQNLENAFLTLRNKIMI